MTEETWSHVYFVVFMTVLLLALGLTAASSAALVLMRPTPSRARFVAGSITLGLSAILMWLPVQPGLIEDQELRRWLFLAGILTLAISHATKISAWLTLRTGLLQERALGRVIRGSDHD